MKHYDLSRWIAFVHGFRSEAARAAMETHLAEGCPVCRRTVSRLRVFSAIARNAAQCKVPPQHTRIRPLVGRSAPDEALASFGSDVSAGVRYDASAADDS